MKKLKPSRRDRLRVRRADVNKRKPLLKHNPTAAGGKCQRRESLTIASNRWLNANDYESYIQRRRLRALLNPFKHIDWDSI